MAGKRKIGIIFCVGESWAGGFYYLLNLIKALKSLSIDERPEITVFYDNEDVIEKVNKLDYPNVSYLPLYKKTSWWKVKITNAAKKFGFKKFYTLGAYPKDTVDIVLPYNYYSFFRSLSNLKKAFWIPDFQHKYYSHNFTDQDLQFREESTAGIIQSDSSLILSSLSAKDDFQKFYPQSKNKIHVLPFCSILDKFESVSLEKVMKDFGFTDHYFISPNQFWKHKNHIIVLKAAKILKEKGIEFNILFTGNESGNDEYVNSLKDFVSENNLHNNIKFLGFLDRNIQLSLIQGAKAVLQPSLFEGWSTVVEDAKALGKYVVASSIYVHKEQLGRSASFFDPNDEFELANILENCWKAETQKVDIDYQENIRLFALKILNID